MATALIVRPHIVVAASLCRGALGIAIGMASPAIALTVGMRFTCRMNTYPRSPKEMTRGMMYFPRMLDKIRLHSRGELHEDYHKNLGAPQTLDGACCNFLRVHHRDLRERVLQGGTDEEILEWCFENDRRPNEGD